MRLSRRKILKGLGSGAAALAGSGIVGGLRRAAWAEVGPGVTDQEVLIGALGPLTGPFGFIGGPGRDGLNMGFAEINGHGGINGRRIKMLFENALTPAESVAAAKKLVEEDKVLALILASGSTGAAAAADYVRQVGVPTYNIFGSTPIIRNPFAKNVFHGAIPEIEVSARALVEQLYDGANPKHIGILAGTYAFPQVTKKGVADILTQRKVPFVIQEFDAAARDYTAQIEAFARAGVDGIVVAGSFSEAGFAIKQGKDRGLDVQWVIDGSAVNRAIIPIIGDADGIRGYFNAPYFPGQKAKPIEEFDARLTKFLGGSLPQGRPNAYDIVGYGSAYVISEAMQAAGKNLSTASLIDAWSNLKGATASKLGGLDVTFPESFSATDHQGNRMIGGAIVRDGAWLVSREIAPA